MICEVELFNVIFPEVIVVLDKDHPPTEPAVLLALLAALAAADAVVLPSAVDWAFDAAVAAAFAVESFVNPESFVKLPIVIPPLPDSFNLFASIVPVVILHHQYLLHYL